MNIWQSKNKYASYKNKIYLYIFILEFMQFYFKLKSLDATELVDKWYQIIFLLIVWCLIGNDIYLGTYFLEKSSFFNLKGFLKWAYL